MAKDIYHEHVKTALIKDGWTITHDPLRLLSKKEGGLETDLGAEKIIVAEKGITKIAVEVKSFVRPSLINEFNKATGQYVSYDESLEMSNNERILYLAMPDEVYAKLISKTIVQRIIKRLKIKILLFNPETKTVESWIESFDFKEL
jgi:XisH protein